jgi:hypothetical protein
MADWIARKREATFARKAPCFWQTTLVMGTRSMRESRTGVLTVIANSLQIPSTFRRQPFERHPTLNLKMPSYSIPPLACSVGRERTCAFQSPVSSLLWLLLDASKGGDL